MGDPAVRVAEVRVQVEPLGRFRSQLELGALVGGVEITEILRRGRCVVIEEIAVVGVGVIERQIRTQPPVEEEALGAHFPRVSDLGLEQIMHAEVVGRCRDRAHAGLIEAAAAKPAAPAAVESQVVARLVAQRALGLRRVEGVLAHFTGDGR